MTPLEASSIFATLIGLLCNWKQERGAVAQDRFQDFITWLEQHHFNDLSAKILASTQLQHELADLLRTDIESITAKLDVMSSGISSIAAHLTNLSGMAKALEAPESKISQQALELLQLFATLLDSKLHMVGTDPRQSYNIVFEPSGKLIKVQSPQFLADDVECLVEAGLLRETTPKDDSDRCYSLTRLGAKFVQQASTSTNLISEFVSPQRKQEVCGGY